MKLFGGPQQGPLHLDPTKGSKFDLTLNIYQNDRFVVHILFKFLTPLEGQNVFLIFNSLWTWLPLLTYFIRFFYLVAILEEGENLIS